MGIGGRGIDKKKRALKNQSSFFNINAYYEKLLTRK